MSARAAQKAKRADGVLLFVELAKGACVDTPGGRRAPAAQVMLAIKAKTEAEAKVAQGKLSETKPDNVVRRRSGLANVFCLGAYMRMCVCVRVRVCTCVSVRRVRRVCVSTCPHVRVCAYVHMSACPRVHVCVRDGIVCKNARIRMYVRMHVCCCHLMAYVCCCRSDGVHCTSRPESLLLLHLGTEQYSKHTHKKAPCTMQLNIRTSLSFTDWL